MKLILIILISFLAIFASAQVTNNVTNITYVTYITNITNIVNVVNVTNVGTATPKYIILPPDEMGILQENLYLSPEEVDTLRSEAILKRRANSMLDKQFPLTKE